MLKKIFISVSLLLTVGALCADNLVKNGSFEDGMKFWGSGPYLPGKIVPQNPSDGQNALLIEGLASPKMIAATQHIPNVKPGVYKAEIDIYLENHSAGEFHPLYFQLLTDQGTKYLSRTIKPGKITTGRHHYELVLNLSEYKKITLAPFILAASGFTGKIYADNFTIIPFETQPPMVVIPKGGGVTLNNFLESETGKPVSHASEIIGSHDGHMLRFKCRIEAPSLNPVFNRLDSFVAGKPGKGSCYGLSKNDSIRISLENQEGVAHFIAINAAGGFAFEREFPDHWDGKWSPEGVVVSAKCENGFWTAEVEIPLKSIGIDKGGKWKTNVVRFDSENGKISVYARTTDLWKDFSSSPELVISEKNFTATLPEITDAITAARCISSNIPLWEIVNLKNDKPVRVLSGSNNIPLGESGIGDSFVFTLCDSAGDVILRTGKLPDAGDAMTGHIVSSEFNSFKVNGREIGTEGGFQLSPGINRISFEPKNPCASKITIGKNTIETAQNEFSILREATTLLPLRPDGVWHLSEGGMYALVWPSGAYASGSLPEKTLNGFSLIVDYPEILELSVPKLKNPQAAAVEVVPMTAAPTRQKVRISMKSPVKLSGAPREFREDMAKKYLGCWLLFMANGKAGTNDEIFVHSEAEDGSVIELPNRIPFDIGPRLEAAKLKKLYISGLFIRVPEFEDSKYNTAMLRNYADSGFTDLTTTPTEAGRAMGIRQNGLFYLIHLKKYFPKDFLAKNPEFAQEFTNPARYARTPGMREALADAWKSWKRDNPLQDRAFIDYEYPPFREGSSCRSDFGIIEFAKKYSLSNVPSWSEIEKNYRSQWIEFSCDEVGNMMKIFSETAAENGIPTMFYSGFQSDFTKEHYAVDWSKIGDAFSIYSAGYGFKTPVIEATRSALGGKNLMLGLLQTGNAATTYSAATMLKYLVTGRAGLLVWYETYNDASVFDNVAKCVNIVAPFEDLIINGKRVDDKIDCKNELRESIAVFELAGEMVAFVFNENVRPLSISFISNGKQYKFELAPGEIRAIRL